MFGYVKPYVPLLKVKDNEFYKALYCGLCGCTAKCNGCTSTLTLSYDIAFLSLLRLSLAGEKLSVVKKRCFAHPLKKRNRIARTKELEFCSGVGVLLSYYKILDNINDEKGKKRFAAVLSKPFFSSSRKKLIKREGDAADTVIREGLEALSTLEKERCNSVDKTSDVFGSMLSKLAALGLEGEKKTIAENAGFAVGKWIYIVDAIDDAEKDAESGAYNPIIELYDGKCPDREKISDVFLALSATKERLAMAVDLISYKEENVTVCDASGRTVNEAYFSNELCAVIENIIGVGMPMIEQKILNSKEA